MPKILAIATTVNKAKKLFRDNTISDVNVGSRSRQRRNSTRTTSKSEGRPRAVARRPSFSKGGCKSPKNSNGRKSPKKSNNASALAAQHTALSEDSHTREVIRGPDNRRSSATLFKVCVQDNNPFAALPVVCLCLSLCMCPCVCLTRTVLQTHMQCLWFCFALLVVCLFGCFFA